MLKTKTNLLFALALGAAISCSPKKTETTEESSGDMAAVEITSAPTSGKYQLKSGIIHFDVNLAGLKGKKIVYFDDYGAKERSEEYDESGTLTSYRFSDGTTRYSVDVPSKTAFISDRNGRLGWEMEFVSWERITALRDYEKDYKKVDNIPVAGKDCEAFDYGGSNTFAGWKGLTLYHEQRPHTVIKAVKLEENVPVDASKFAVPEGYEVKEFTY